MHVTNENEVARDYEYDLNSKTWEDCRDDPSGTIYADWEDKELRCLILRGPVSVNAYIGVKPGNPLYGVGYDDIDVRCHGGLTFANEGGRGVWPSDYWWLGWDYAHSGDRCFYDRWNSTDELAWTPRMIQGEFPEVITSLRLAADNYQLSEKSEA